MDILNLCFIIISICNSISVVLLFVSFMRLYNVHNRNKKAINFFVNWCLDELHEIRKKLW